MSTTFLPGRIRQGLKLRPDAQGVTATGRRFGNGPYGHSASASRPGKSLKARRTR